MWSTENKISFVSVESNLTIIMVFEENVSVVVLFRLSLYLDELKRVNAKIVGVW